jgi:hypothetical protein
MTGLSIQLAPPVHPCKCSLSKVLPTRGTKGRGVMLSDTSKDSVSSARVNECDGGRSVKVLNAVPQSPQCHDLHRLRLFCLCLSRKLHFKKAASLKRRAMLERSRNGLKQDEKISTTSLNMNLAPGIKRRGKKTRGGSRVILTL